MAKYVLVTMPSVPEGYERQVDEWHEQFHIREMVRLPGFVAAQRYHLAHVQLGAPGAKAGDPDGPPIPLADPWPFLTIYEIETDDPEAMMKALHAEAPNQTRLEGVPHDVRPHYFWFYGAVSERIESPPDSTHPLLSPKDAVDAVALAKRFSSASVD